MSNRAWIITILVVGVLTAGCLSMIGEQNVTTNTSTPQEATTTSVPKTPTFSDSEARTRAKQAERDRIEQALNDTSGISEVSVGVYGENKAEIVSTGPDSYTVRVTMSYSYEYSCSGRSGAIDGLTTSVTYRVSAESVELLSVEEPIDNLCGR